MTLHVFFVSHLNNKDMGSNTSTPSIPTASTSTPTPTPTPEITRDVKFAKRLLLTIQNLQPPLFDANASEPVKDIPDFIENIAHNRSEYVPFLTQLSEDDIAYLGENEQDVNTYRNKTVVLFARKTVPGLVDDIIEEGWTCLNLNDVSTADRLIAKLKEDAIPLFGTFGFDVLYTVVGGNVSDLLNDAPRRKKRRPSPLSSSSSSSPSVSLYS
jgi:hypothetical protein